MASRARCADDFFASFATLRRPRVLTSRCLPLSLDPGRQRTKLRPTAAVRNSLRHFGGRFRCRNTVSLTVNGKPATATVEGRTLLVQLLRENLGLTGTHVGCDTSQCGACVVHVDGEAVKSCTLLAVQADGPDITTIEGARQWRRAAPDAGGLPRQSRAAMRLLHARHDHERARPGEAQPAPSDREIREYLEGNLCRCTGYQNIVLADQSGSRRMRGAPAPSGGHDRWRPRSGRRSAGAEDYRFVTGQGTYTDDINRPGQLHAYILRSPHAHAAIRGIDTKAAASAPGVEAVFTGADMAKDAIGGLPCGWLINSKDGSPMKEPPHPVLADGRVRHVGDPVAVVIADTLANARDAAEKIAVDYAVEPAIIDGAAALKAGAAQVGREAPGNICYDWDLGDLAATDAAIAKAARVVKLDLVNNRLVPNAMEPRAAIGEFDRATGEYTLYTTSQNPHVIRLLMGAFVLHIPEAKLRVVAPDVGGGFGSKIYHYAEEAIVTWAAGKVRKPIKWTAERSESFMSDAHGRDHVTHVELALDADNKFTALKVSTHRQYGRLSVDLRDLHPDLSLRDPARRHVHDPGDLRRDQGGLYPHRAGRRLSRRRAAGGDVPAGTHRRSGGAMSWASTRPICGAELHPARRISRTRLPWRCNTTAATTTRRSTRRCRRPTTPVSRRGGARRRGAASCAASASPPISRRAASPRRRWSARSAPRAGLFESAEVRVHPTGSITVLTGSHSHGQGHETTFAQLVADGLGMPIEQHRDRARRHQQDPLWHGHLRLALAGGRRQRDRQGAGQDHRQGQKIAAHLLEAAEADVEFEDGASASPARRSKTLGEIALTAYVPPTFRTRRWSRASTRPRSTSRRTSPFRRARTRRGRDRPRHRRSTIVHLPRWTISAGSSIR